MKKIFLFLVMIVFAGSIFAQIKVDRVISNDRPTDKATVENGASTITAPLKVPTFSKDLEPRTLGSSMNFYGMYTSGLNPIVYNPKVNTIAFAHRAAAGSVSPDESGEIGLDYSLDGGDTWVTDVHISPSMSTSGTEGRYPQIAIYAPTTDVADARFVEVGPSHSFYGGTGDPWGKIHHIDGNFSETPTVNEVYSNYYSSDFDGVPNRVIDDADGNVWMVIPNLDDQNAPTYLAGLKYKLVKGSYSEGDGNFNWMEMATIEPPHMIENSYSYAYDFNLAAHPTDANILYFVANTVLDGDAYITQSHPHVYESIDGGANWTLISTFNMNDFIEEFNEDGIPWYEGDVSAFPHVYEIDPVVDAYGMLHIFSRVTGGAADFGFYSAGNWTLDETGMRQFQHYYDITLDIENDVWDINYLAPKICKVETGSWGDIEIRIHTQIAKNEFSDRIMFIWDETTTSPDSSHTAPNIVGVGYNATDGTYYEKEEFTPTGSGADGICFFSQASTYLMEVDGHYEIPAVICPEVDPNATGAPDVEISNFMYIKGLESALLPVSDGPVAVEETIIDPVLVYPNPVADILYIGTNAKVSLCDITGKELLIIENNNEKL